MAYKNDDGDICVWAVVDQETGEIADGEEICANDDELYELTQGVEWRMFKLVPAP